VAVATNTHPGPWWDEDEETIVTVVDILNAQAEQIREVSRGR
jgi:hypothetical protein